MLEVAELIERRAGRRQQDHGLAAFALGVLGRLPHGRLERAGLRERNLAVERRRESIDGVADQVGALDAREEPAEALYAARLGLAARDPIDLVETRERARGGVGVRRLRILDEAHPPDLPARFDPCLQTRDR